MAEQTVLVVDDEPRIVEFLSENLTADDYAVLSASNGEEALEVLGRTRPDVLLLDVVLPGISGYEVCRRVRDADRVRGLQRGADDYATKPFHYPELLARISSLLKRVQRIDESHLLRTGELVVNTLSREVTMGGHLIHLSVKEFQLLATLATEPARVFSKRELLETVWDFRSPGRTRTLDSHASRLRQKLGEHSDAAWIVNVWGVGYRLHRPE